MNGSKRWFARIVLVAAMPLAILAACQDRLIYFPRPYQPPQIDGFLGSGGRRIEAQTSQGKQVAWLRLPSGGAPVARLWVACGGNGTLALELQDVLRLLPAKGDAVLYFDYPGYGECSGATTPARLRESLRALVPLAAEACGLRREDLVERGVVFGHSLGAAVALLAADEFGIKRAVLLSGFTSTMAMSSRVVGLPLGFLVTHRYDNVEQVRALAARGGQCWLLHGADDEVVPVEMGRELAATLGAAATYTEVPGVGHNDIFDVAPHAIRDALFAARSGKDTP